MSQEDNALLRKIYKLLIVNYSNKPGRPADPPGSKEFLKNFLIDRGIIGVQRDVGQGNEGINYQKFRALVITITRNLRNATITDYDVNAYNILLLGATNVDSNSEFTRIGDYVTPVITVTYLGNNYNIPSFLFEDGRPIDNLLEAVAVIVLTTMLEIGNIDSDIIIGTDARENFDMLIKLMGIQVKSARNVAIPPIEPIQPLTDPNLPDNNIKEFNEFTNPGDPDEEELLEFAEEILDPSEPRTITPKQIDEIRRDFNNPRPRSRSFDRTPVEIKKSNSVPNIALNVYDVLATQPEQVADAAVEEVDLNIASMLLFNILTIMANQPAEEVKLAEEIEEVEVPRIVGGLSGGPDFIGRPNPHPDSDINQIINNFINTNIAREKEVYFNQMKGMLEQFTKSYSNSLFSGQFYETIREFCSVLMNYDRGVGNLIDISTISAGHPTPEQINVILDEMVQQLDSLATIVSITLGLTSVYIVRSIYSSVFAGLLIFLGYSTPITRVPIPFKVEKYTVVQDKTGKTLSINRIDDDANFYPEPISNQNVYEIIADPVSYKVNMIYPTKATVESRQNFDFGLYNYIGNSLLPLSEQNVEPTFLQPTYQLKDNVIFGIDDVYTTIMQGNKVLSMESINQFNDTFKVYLLRNKNVFINLVMQPAKGRGGGPPDDDNDDDFGGESDSDPNKLDKNDGSYAKTPEGQWYIVKTLIYWLMKNIRIYYELTSTHIKHLFSICYDLAISIFTNIVGQHPYIFTTVSAVAVLQPDLILDVFDTLIFFVSSLTSIVKKVFSFFSSTTGLVIIGVGAALLLYTLSKSINKVSIF